jgi:hypothetical protein
MKHTNEEIIKDIKEVGKLAQGKNELIAIMEGKPVSKGDAIKAMCYDCQAYCQDGRQDCGQTQCPLYQHHAYNPNRRKLHRNTEHLHKKKEEGSQDTQG